ncbi:uncharacterized protein LOC105181513 [Harpegnathos saltator]|uniref:uncharacterized protein LOC105181513 n=1 Tax=Harpegnathos saltator TaxID=610380 RepID=UPI00058E6AE3|nr:uncharacterized protein LOC105181513 [Harpegnathos saltator]
MKKIYTAIVLAIYTYNIFLAIGLSERYCFQFTWPGSNNLTVNCTNNIPCVKPFYYNISKPNTNEIWNKYKERVEESNYFCKLNSDVCIRYTYIYNDAVVNVSYFCGKVIEDQTSPITLGCYAQHTEGYTIEACACQSRNNSMPCNAIKNTYSIFITIGATAVTLFMYKIFNIS